MTIDTIYFYIFHVLIFDACIQPERTFVGLYTLTLTFSYLFRTQTLANRRAIHGSRSILLIRMNGLTSKSIASKQLPKGPFRRIIGLADKRDCPPHFFKDAFPRTGSCIPR